LAPFRCAPFKSAPVKFEFVSTAPGRYASRMLAPDRSQSTQTGLVLRRSTALGSKAFEYEVPKPIASPMAIAVRFKAQTNILRGSTLS
jgi:hypothetical protein